MLPGKTDLGVGATTAAARSSHNRDGRVERGDVWPVGPHIQLVSHFILSFSPSASHFIALVSPQHGQSVSQAVRQAGRQAVCQSIYLFLQKKKKVVESCSPKNNSCSM